MPPFLSIVIPTFNRASELEKTLQSYVEQEFADYEIVIVDNGPSSDNTAEVVGRFAGALPIIYHRTTLKGVTFARSIGNLLVRGDVIIQTDDDISFLHPTVLERTVSLFKQYTTIDILGALELKTSQVQHPRLAELAGAAIEGLPLQAMPPRTATIDDWYNIYTGHEILLDLPAGLYACTSFRSCFMAYRRKVLQKVPNFDINLSAISRRMPFREETDFLQRCQDCNFHIYLTNLIVFLHRVGKRSGCIPSRSNLAANVQYKSACHAYFAAKNLVEKKEYRKIVPWIVFQFFVGYFKNPGIKYHFQQKEFLDIFPMAAGFLEGLLWGLGKKRRLLKFHEISRHQVR